jgi:hypothetical protein
MSALSRLLDHASSRGRCIALLVAAALLAPDSTAQTMKGGFHQDARFGFKVKPPKDWSSIPVPSGQAWVVAKFLSDKKHFFTEKGGGFTYEFQPEMTVIAFVSSELKKAARKEAEKEAENEQTESKAPKEGDVSVVVASAESDYRDYKDYLTKTYKDSGFYFSREEASEHDGLRTTIFEARAEKSGWGGPKRIVTWLYSLPDVDVAVQIEVLEGDVDKMKTVLDGVFKSFQAIAREGEMPLNQGTVGSTVFFISLDDMEKLTPADRERRRKEQQDDAHRKATEGLGEGWHTAKMDGFLVVSCADERFDKQVVEQASAVFEWLEKTFPYVGAGEYVREPILRVCRNFEEENSFREDAGWWDMAGLGLEATTNKEGGGARGYAFSYLNVRMVDIWFVDRDLELWWAMPNWLQTGIRSLVSDATAKSGKLDIGKDEWTSAKLRELVREERATTPKDLIHLTGSDFWGEGSDVFGRVKEAQALVEYLLVGPGSKGSTKGLIKSYIENLKAVTSEIREAEKKEQKPAAEAAPATEEEEQKRLQERREEWKKREQELLDEVGRRTFAGWDDNRWKELAKSYFKSL